MDLNDNTVYYARYYVEETKEKLFENIPLEENYKNITLHIKYDKLILDYDDHDEEISYYSIINFSSTKNKYGFTTKDNMSHYFIHPKATKIFDLIYKRCLALSKL